MESHIKNRINYLKKDVDLFLKDKNLYEIWNKS